MCAEDVIVTSSQEDENEIEKYDDIDTEIDLNEDELFKEETEDQIDLNDIDVETTFDSEDEFEDDEADEIEEKEDDEIESEFSLIDEVIHENEVDDDDYPISDSNNDIIDSYDENDEFTFDDEDSDDIEEEEDF